MLEGITDRTTARRAAEWYRADGLDPIPIYGIADGACTCGRPDCVNSAGKHPVGARWESREISLDEFTWGRNVGLRMGGERRLIAIDVDGSEGAASLLALEERLGKLPSTLTSQSGSGGQHLVFETAAVERMRNSAKKLAPSIDIRAGGGQIVVAPSLHRSGGHYRWTNHGAVAQLPSAWEQAVLALNEEPKREEPSRPEQQHNGTHDRARRYIEKMEPAISGQGGHNATWAVACKLVHGFGLSDSDAMSILLSDYNPRCQPPWSKRELEHKVRQARGRAGVLAKQVEDRELPGWRDDVPEPPDWFGPPADEWGDDPQEGDDEDVERQAIQGEPQAAKKPAEQKPDPSVRILSMSDLLMPVVDDMKNAGPLAMTGVPTGVAELDTAIGRYRPGNVTILGAKRSFGKTSFSLVNIDAALAAKRGLLVFAVEDSIQMYSRRFMARRSGVNALMLRDMSNKFTPVQIDRAVEAVSKAEREPFFISAIGMPVEDIANTIKQIGKQRTVELVIVDYLQRIRARKSYPDRRLMLSSVANILVDAGKGIGAHTLLLSQLRRTEHRRPEVEDLKESGDLEDIADHILLGHRERNQNTDRRLLIVAKNKDGIDDLPDFDLDFASASASFTGRATEVGGRMQQPEPDRQYVDQGNWAQKSRDDGFTDFDEGRF
jgi:replicative DNA helicase